MTNKETITNIKVMLERTNNLVFYKDEIEAIKKDLDRLEKLEKAIKIIEEKSPNITLEIKKCKNYKEYVEKFATYYKPQYILSREEWVYLKEMFYDN